MKLPVVCFYLHFRFPDLNVGSDYSDLSLEILVVIQGLVDIGGSMGHSVLPLHFEDKHSLL